MANTLYTKPAASDPVAIQGMDWDCAAACTNDASTTAWIDKRGFSHGSFYVPTGSSITTITWYGAHAIGATPRAAKDQDRVAITQTTAADEMCELPSALAGYPHVIPVTNASGTLYIHWER